MDLKGEEREREKERQRFLTLLHRSLGYHGESVLHQLPSSSDLRLAGQDRAALPENVLKAESHFLSFERTIARADRSRKEWDSAITVRRTKER